MSGLDFERKKRSDPQLNIAPLLDIVFLLLIFFVLTSHFVNEKGFNIKLPKAAHATSQNSEKVTVSIDENENVFIGNLGADMDSLSDVLKDQLNSAETKTVVIKADKSVDIGFAVKIMDIVKEANAEGIVISTRVSDNEQD